MKDSDVVKDWEGVDFEEIRFDLAWARHSVEMSEPVYNTLIIILNSLEQIRDRQLKEANKNVPAILRK
jgi:hypothetical protein